MSFTLRQKLGTSMMMGSRKAMRMSAGAVAPANELTNNWLRKLGDAANSQYAKDQHNQLQQVLDFYNRATEKKLHPIDWDGHRARIHTSGVVDKIKDKYDAFMDTTYTVDNAVMRCGGTTEKMQALDVSLQYNFMLYFVSYASHLTQIETMRNAGDVTQMSNLEVMKLMPGIDALTSSQLEIGNLSPEDYNENGLYTRMCTQFSWGSRYVPPFNHSSDAFNCVASTMGKLGD